MSNMQDVPLPEPEGLDGSGVASTVSTKSTSLKRFFKLSKKPHNFQEELQDVAESAGRQKDPSKNNTMGRFFTRFKNAQKDGDEPVSSTSNVTTVAGEEEQQQQDQGQVSNKPLPNVKPTIKESISSYWKMLFTRTKAQKQAGSGMSVGMEEVHELQQVKQDQTQSDGQFNQSDREEDIEVLNTPQPEVAVALTLQELED
ncbi:uncharacterized protein [Drosophila pseudoobscura]|uniref:Uncharacterized protein n=1 Tax=Drosophila pseudoobscura pseudoobscura TaxID=46245 RepID=A0A6I8USB6_DROPS|nr:uncharacterized protein LOC4803247 [Drosophila pseudoobscura]